MANQSAQDLEGELNRLKRQIKRLDRMNLLGLVFILSVLLFQRITLSYVSGAITHFEQVYTICLPYLSESERASIRSDFARIRSKKDYVQVLDKLQETALKHSVLTPNFAAW